MTDEDTILYNARDTSYALGNPIYMKHNGMGLHHVAL